MTSGVAGVQSRIAAIQSQLAMLQPVAVRQPANTGTVSALSLSPTGTGSAPAFSDVLSRAEAAAPASPSVRGSNGSAGERVIAAARQYLGVPYLWGGTDPAKGLDCSGFVQRSFRDIGVELPRVSADQARAGRAVGSLAEAQPGDLVAFDYSSSRPGIDHIGIYVGDGKMIHTNRAGQPVRIEEIKGTPATIRRVLPEGGSPAGISGTSGSSDVPGGVPFADLFAAAGARHGVSPALLTAVARAESNFNPRAVSHAGAQGLMQLMPATAKGLGVTDSFDPAQAVDGAARLLAGHLERFGSVELGLAAYNAGPGAVQRYGGVPPYRETQAYVAKIMKELS
jgi:cell wall-associated NlpC family hydrolase